MARERYLHNAGEETINAPGAEIKIETPKGKWDNFWFYHKWHVIIALAVVALVGFFIHDMLSVVHPDYQIGLITQVGYSSEATDKLEQGLEKYGEDLNHDGKVVVQINSYVVSANPDSADPNMQMASVTKLMADLSDGMSMIFLTDDASFQNEQKSQQLFAYLDGTSPAANATDYDKMRISLKNAANLQSLKSSVSTGEEALMLNNLSASLRIVKGTKAEDKQTEYYSASKKLFDQVFLNGK